MKTLSTTQTLQISGGVVAYSPDSGLVYLSDATDAFMLYINPSLSVLYARGEDGFVNAAFSDDNFIYPLPPESNLFHNEIGFHAFDDSFFKKIA